MCGLAVAGSWLTGEIDEFSDLDLVIVCNNGDFPQILKNRIEIAKSLGAHLSGFTGEHVGEPRLLICLFRDPLIHVDLKFVALKDFHDRIENPWIAWERDGGLNNAILECPPNELKADPQWIEDRFWTWVHYCAAKIGRGELYETIGSLGFLRERVLAPLALWLNRKPVRGVRRIEKYLPDFAHKLEKTIPAYDKRSCIEALYATINIYRELRKQIETGAPTIRADVETEALKYLSGISG